MIRYYSKNIQNEILKELFKAKSSIKIAVAWFTNDLLFQPLLLKRQLGVSIELVTNFDEINLSMTNKVDFGKLTEDGGIIHWNKTDKLMHDKFCIIDNSVVITGSYNWTNKAEINDESISISYGEIQTLRFYSERFASLSKQYCNSSNILSNTAQMAAAINIDARTAQASQRSGNNSTAVNSYGYSLVNNTATSNSRNCPQNANKTTKPIIKKQDPNLLLSRECGDDVTFSLYRNGDFVLAGNGTIPASENDLYPWFAVRDRIKVVKSSVNIPDNAFIDYQSIENLVINFGCKEIGNNAFRNCKSLKSVTGQHLKKTGTQSFMNCVSLSTCILAEEIGERAFCNCNSLVYIETDYYPEPSSYDIIKEKFSGYYSLLSDTGREEMEKKRQEVKNRISYSYKCKSIGDEAFMGCTGLIDISLSYTIANIGKYAFKDCISLYRLYIGGIIQEIGDYAFLNCPNLHTVHFCRNTIKIGHQIFSECNAIKVIQIPSYPTFPQNFLHNYSDKIRQYHVDTPLEKKIKEMNMPSIPRCSFDSAEEVKEYDINPKKILYLGYGYGIYPQDIVIIPDEEPFIIAFNPPFQDKEGRRIYYLKVIRNDRPSWLVMSELIRCDYLGKPLGKVEETMLKCKSLRDMHNLLRGKALVGGKMKEYTLSIYKNGIKTGETKIFRRTEIGLV